MLKIITGIFIGAMAGGLIGYMAKSAGGTSLLTCNPIVATGVGALIGGLLVATRRNRKGNFRKSPEVVFLKTPQTIDQAVTKKGVSVVDFYAEWCRPCRMLKPVLHELADDYSGDISVIEVDVEKYTDEAWKYGVSRLPDVRVFKDGKVLDKFVGVWERASYESAVQRAMNYAGGS